MNGPAMLSLLSAAAPVAAATEPPAYLQFLPLVAMAGVFYFLILRPQMRRQKDHQTKLSALQKGDQVVTAGGLLAKVIKVDENTVDLELAPNVRVKAVKSTIGDIVPPGGAAAAND
ncbi:preprotein translocase subunit YajC [Novosphingobium sp. KCTC 2891]|uniref:preprotein translocase subunit YajC n=1 Tax=Novosphingobium sp. KCTC 2891 TaxID=2989730 RepID=UPI002222869B|nr:preprotein translocase subunit YajC [Novosphingobium sp. KCTC 2891]MCW1384102.1 preprotein translocase subunit YajC [Novosphingobium sp. KCTC 2891]